MYISVRLYETEVVFPNGTKTRSYSAAIVEERCQQILKKGCLSKPFDKQGTSEFISQSAIGLNRDEGSKKHGISFPQRVFPL